MIDPSDADYQETRLIRRGVATLAPRFADTADWIASSYGVRPLNLHLDRIAPDDRPRLTVIFEFGQEADQFLDADGFNFDEAKQDAIAAAFTALNPGLAAEPRLLVVLADFASVARMDVNAQVQRAHGDRLDREAAQDGYWRFWIELDSAVLFAFTAAAAARARADIEAIAVVRSYRRHVAALDEFGYFSTHPPVVEVDSKEVFDRDYQGNWSFYVRRA